MNRIPLYISVETHNLAASTPDLLAIESERRIDYNRPADRAWLTRHSLWALSHGRSVLTTPIKEA